MAPGVGERRARARADGMDVQAVSPGRAAHDADVDSYGAGRVLPKLRSAHPGAGLIEQYRVRSEGGRGDSRRGGRRTTRQGQRR